MGFRFGIQTSVEFNKPRYVHPSLVLIMYSTLLGYEGSVVFFLHLLLHQSSSPFLLLFLFGSN